MRTLRRTATTVVRVGVCRAVAATVGQDDRVSTRTLVILRHAKAATPGAVADADRPLTPRGHADAAAAGAWLNRRGYRPDLVLCSPARRTRETWHGAALALTAAPSVRYEPDVYAAPAGALLDLVRGVDDSIGTVLIIGHNPSVSQLSALLDPAGTETDGLRTAGLAVHAMEGHWVDCGPRKAALVDAHTARDS
jgi:phosphohistidine phosphatase